LDGLAEPRIRLLERDTSGRAFDLDEAEAVLAVGAGVGDAAAVDELRALAAELGAAVGGDRRACEAGLLPPVRQLGLLGRSVAPRLYVAVETEGDFEHLVASVKASVILVLKSSGGPVTGTADVALVGDWRDTLPPLIDALAGAL
jgi:electron transfer flavoprotein alpha subunit